MSTAPRSKEPREGPSDPELGFDERLARLEEIVRGLEGGGQSLEQSIERYKEGVALLSGCRALLERYRAQVEELGRAAEGGLEAFDGDPDVLRGGGGSGEKA